MLKTIGGEKNMLNALQLYNIVLATTQKTLETA